MKFPLFSIFLIFIAWFTFNRLRMDKKEKEQDSKFWQRESQANATRLKDISNLNYITIPTQELPFGIRPEDTVLTQCEARILELSQERILNLTGITNTQLKLDYGAPNLTRLTAYDQNFTELVRLMQQWGERLYELSLRGEAEQVLHRAIAWGSDIKASYLLLGKIYQETNNWTGFSALKEYANLLNSLMKEPILAALNQLDS